MKTICYYHNKDLDGYTSGAVVRRAFPDCELVGWDYGLPVPEVGKGNQVVIIDICFPMKDMLRIAEENDVTWIDHHISQHKEWNQLDEILRHKLKYIYGNNISACELGWKYFFPEEPMPKAVELLGKYDTWRGAESKEWRTETLPFQYYMRTYCTDPESFPTVLFDEDFLVYDAIEMGSAILKYHENQEMLKCQRGAFEREVYGGLKALCLNEGVFSSETMRTMKPERYDVLVGFVYNKSFWRVSLRTLKEDVDVSVIAKTRGGGGHKKAAGFEVKTFDEIFK